MKHRTTTTERRQIALRLARMRDALALSYEIIDAPRSRMTALQLAAASSMFAVLGNGLPSWMRTDATVQARIIQPARRLYARTVAVSS